MNKQEKWVRIVQSLFLSFTVFIFIFILFLLITTSCFALDDNYWSYEERCKRNTERHEKEIEHIRRMKELELQYKIYMTELTLKRENINIDTFISQSEFESQNIDNSNKNSNSVKWIERN